MPDQKVRRTIAYAACAWAIVFGAPHVWWALGVSWGFPGGEEQYARFMSSDWRRVYDGVVIACCVLAIAVVLTLQKPPAQVVHRKVPVFLAWLACTILMFRAIAGFIFDGTDDLVWNPLFFAGGMLMGAVAWMARAPKPATAPAASTR